MSRRLLELNEKVAEGLARKEDLEVMRSGWLRRLDAAGHPPWRMALVHATETNYQVFPHSARGTAYHAAAAVESTTAEQACQCALLRCIVGPRQFRDVVLTPAWRTATVMSVAQAIYDDRAFDRLPILADALEDAGCTDHAILDHCRQPGEHVRGCWVVDLVLGKE